jgi:uncharacterized protein YndB with AHSA1/START domain
VIRVEFTIEVARPAQEVFEYLTDVDRVPEWQASALEARANGPLARGSRITERRKLFGHEAQTVLEVTEYEPPARLTLRALDGPVRFRVEHRLEELDSDTHLHVLGEARPTGMLRFAGPVVERKAREELRRDFERLKEILESGRA